MRLLRVVAVAVGGVSITGLSAAAPTTASTLVALGDSYSSGQGVPPYEPGSTGRRNTCYRSGGAWPILVGRALGMQRQSVACSGAEVPEVKRSDDRRAPGRQESQISRMGAAPALVTITIGGNDVGFRGVLTRCVAFRDCHDGFGKKGRDEIEEEIDDLGPELVHTYQAIRQAAPQARVVVVGYPRIFPRDIPRRSTARNCAAWNRVNTKEASYLNAKTRSLNAAIARAAAEADVEFVDVTGAFEGHELRCDAEPWIHKLKLFRKRRLVSLTSFHPTRAGHRRLAEVVLSRLR